ncbi:hypothetical protein ABZT43_44895, partial [Streptomyces sp. NPDC005349]|uniref:hypothetical protein n=1 Tax=Streptomyces sp. NPDC005349 TaxID=3157037 RepID=UPI0033B6DC83
TSDLSLDPVEQAIRDIANGRPVVVVDDEDREPGSAPEHRLSAHALSPPSVRGRPLDQLRFQLRELLLAESRQRCRSL